MAEYFVVEVWNYDGEIWAIFKNTKGLPTRKLRQLLDRLREEEWEAMVKKAKEKKVITGSDLLESLTKRLSREGFEQIKFYTYSFFDDYWYDKEFDDLRREKEKKAKEIVVGKEGSIVIKK